MQGGGKERVVYQILLHPFGGNIAGDPRIEENQQDVNDPQDSMSADSDNRESEAGIVLTDPKPVGEGDTICVQHVEVEGKPNYWPQFIWSWVNAYMSISNMKFSLEIHQGAFSGLYSTQ